MAIGNAIGIPWRKGRTLPPLLDSIRQWLTGTADDGLKIKDKLTTVTPEPDIVGRSVVAFDGVDGTFAFQTSLSTTWDITVVAKITGIPNTIFSKGAGGGTSTDVFIDIVGGSLRGVFYSGTAPKITAGGFTADSDFHTFRYVNTGPAQTLYLDGNIIASTSHSDTPNDTSNNAYLFSRAGSQLYTEGTLAYAAVDGGIFAFEETSGTTAYDISGNGNHGTLSGGTTHTTADGIASPNMLEGFTLSGSVMIPALADGSGNDALGNPLTNPGGYVSNGSEVGRRQSLTATALLDNVETCIDGACENPSYFGAEAGKPSFATSSTKLYWGYDGSDTGWVYDHNAVQAPLTDYTTHPTATGQYPPKTGWPNTTSGKTFSADYDSPDIADDGSLKTLYYADDLARANKANNVADQWEDVNGVQMLKRRLTYNQGVIAGMTAAQEAQLDRWIANG